MLGTPLDPWEEFAVIRAGELLPDGRPRFRKVLIIVGRQNGKTFLIRVLTLYWLFIEGWEMVFGMSTTSAMAKFQWELVVEKARELEALAPDIRRVTSGTGMESLKTVDGAEYRFGASNENAGRSLSVDRLIIDELRKHKTWAAWNASYNTMNARPHGQAFCITNQGDLTAVVLRSLRADALKAIKEGDDTGDVCLLEWSAPDDASPMDVTALAQANPNMNRVGADGVLRMDQGTLLGEARRVVLAGGEELATFRIEVMCQEVDALDGAIDSVKWTDECHVPGDLANLRGRLAACLDISPDRKHATLVAAGMLPDGRVRVEVVDSWSGDDATRKLRRELPTLLKQLRPQKFGWMPNGPAAALAADLAERKGVRGWPPQGVAVEEIRGEVSAICMGLAEQVDSLEVVHSNQLLLNTHITGAEKLWSGDTWRFSRRGEGHCDAAYAAAGAAHLARTLPTPIGRPRLITA